MKTLAESLFDTDAIKDDITTLYDLINGHVTKFKTVWGKVLVGLTSSIAMLL